MPTHTIELTDEEMTIIQVVGGIIGGSKHQSVKKVVSFIIRDYSKLEEYSDFIKKRKEANRKRKKK